MGRGRGCWCSRRRTGIGSGSRRCLRGWSLGVGGRLRPIIVHCFVARRRDFLTILETARARLKPDGAIWVSWPKKAARVATDITEDIIREIALPLGFVDIKVCAVSEVWSGPKLVIRKALRTTP
ncbi:MAG: DUF3052 family protein [Gemmatimonadetes bacterium]|nr:DUF3052 family protein [Gemmatimonadota bacterium]